MSSLPSAPIEYQVRIIKTPTLGLGYKAEVWLNNERVDYDYAITHFGAIWAARKIINKQKRSSREVKRYMVTKA